MTLTSDQKMAAQAVVQIFETSSVMGDYGMVTLIDGDTGHLTYGKAQTTLGTGNLYLLIKDYVEADAAEFAVDLTPYLTRLSQHDVSLDHDTKLKRTLRAAGDDPVMRKVQDTFFDRVYWQPTIKSATYIDAETALGIAIIYDGWIHGRWHGVRDEVIAKFGKLSVIGEKKWFQHYVTHRRDWLATSSRADLRKTVYRMDAFQALIDGEHWNLDLPFVVRTITVSKESLGLTGQPPIRISAEPEIQPRLLKLDDPIFVGEDVKALQLALNGQGYDLVADGKFGGSTDSALKDFQARAGLRADGIAGMLTRDALGL